MTMPTDEQLAFEQENLRAYREGRSRPLQQVIEEKRETLKATTPTIGPGAADNLYTAGIPDETITITVLGNPALAAKAIGATEMAWKDGGAQGTWAAAKLMSTHPGGSLDGQVTTELVFKPILSTTTATG